MHSHQIFVSNYLSKARYPSGKLFGIGLIVFCYFMSSLYWFDDLGVYLSANRLKAIEDGQYWRLVSSTFIHGSLTHFLSNSMMLFILSLVTVSFYGHIFTTLYILCSGTLINYITLMSHANQETSLVGASGVIFCLWGFWLILFFFLERQRTVLSRILRIGAVFFVLLVPTSYDPSTSYRAHYIGFFIGVIVGLVYYLVSRKRLHSFETWRDKPDDYDDDGGLPWREGLDEVDSTELR